MTVKSEYVRIKNKKVSDCNMIYTDNETLISELKRIQKENGWTGKQIAEKLEMSPQLYQKLINKKQFGFADLKRICDVMDYDVIIHIVPKDQKD
ncbi:helix-turn-helix transcriptional regulator [Clostridium sp. AF32-12BH]|uniref:helix-turn-helix domain-containing protein n=1 Tax=Clostridium sp. AF32-12BH TaxID=2292006 RepID=UPI001A9BF7C1|nr:helix-turn-helix transcriptional regulator [Clostridium sp. AF32-12BH]